MSWFLPVLRSGRNAVPVNKPGFVYVFIFCTACIQEYCSSAGLLLVIERKQAITVPQLSNRISSSVQVIRTLEEPTAAALAFGLHRKPNVNHILVYDLGGGTLDVSVLFVNDGSVEVIGSDGDDNLGGKHGVTYLAVLEHKRKKRFSPKIAKTERRDTWASIPLNPRF